MFICKVLSFASSAVPDNSGQRGGKIPLSAALFRAWIPFILAAAVCAVFCSGTVMAEESCSELLKNRCTQCHYLTRVCQKLEKNMDKGSFFGGFLSGSWGRTVSNMVRQGARLNDTEKQKLVECLNNASPEVLKVCSLKK